MKLGEWLQINEKHYPHNNIVLLLIDIYFKYFWIALLKDNYGYEFYFKLLKIELHFAQNKEKRRINLQ